MEARTATLARQTSETDITVQLNLDGAGVANIETGLGFFDHMLISLTKHARFDLDLACRGDLQVDDHHTIEDCALAFGQAIDRALADRKGIVRFSHAFAPLDDALVRAVIDFSGRPFAHVLFHFERPVIGDVACENITHFFQTLATAARMCLHLDEIRACNDHHRAEAGFKAIALALRTAIARSGFDDVPSTKGVL